MAEWLDTPLIVVAALSILGVSWKILRRVVEIDLAVKDIQHFRAVEFKEFAREVRGEIKDIRGEIKDIRGEMTEVRSGLQEVRSGLQEVRGGLQEVRGDVRELFRRLPAAPTGGASPRRLTDLGERMADFLAAQAWAKDLAPHLQEQVAGKRPFEIDAVSDDYVRTKIEDPAMQERIAECAYEFGLERDGVLSVLRVVLRDELLRTAAPPESA